MLLFVHCPNATEKMKCWWWMIIFSRLRSLMWVAPTQTWPSRVLVRPVQVMEARLVRTVLDLVVRLARTGVRDVASHCGTARPWWPWTSSTTSGVSSARPARSSCTASTWGTRGGPTARSVTTRSSGSDVHIVTGMATVSIVKLSEIISYLSLHQSYKSLTQSISNYERSRIFFH